MTKFLKKNKKGFSLAELIVVIAILGILAAVVIPRVTENTDEARIAHDRATLRTVQGAVNMFYAKHGRFPGRTPAGAVIEGYAYAHLATEIDANGGNLQAFLDLGTPAAMPAARSRSGGALRVFVYDPGTGTVSATPALPPVN